MILTYVPVIEKPSTDHFLVEDPYTAFEEGNFIQVPLVIGINRDEGTLLYRGQHILRH